MRVVFFGTPQFAAPTLTTLLRSKHQVLGVITQPDEPKGRGHQVSAPPIKNLALQENIEVLQPEKIKDEQFFSRLNQWEADAYIVIAFGRILPKKILGIPKLGCINLHGSLLPKYRGAAPIQWAICNGETKTGVTSILMDEGMDTGPILLKQSVNIHPREHANSLASRLATIGAEIILETIDRLESNTLVPQPQDSAHASFAPILKKTDGAIQWNASAYQIENLVRGMDPWPGAYTYYGDQQWKLWEVKAFDFPSDNNPGTILEATRDTINVATGNGTITIYELQPASRRRMPVRAYLSGHTIPPGTVLKNTPLPRAANKQ